METYLKKKKIKKENMGKIDIITYLKKINTKRISKKLLRFKKVLILVIVIVILIE